MIKQHKKMLILTSVITLLPIFIGLLLWRQLPASVATHFGVDNQPDGYCSKAFAVFALPVMMLFFHLHALRQLRQFAVLLHTAWSQLPAAALCRQTCR